MFLQQQLNKSNPIPQVVLVNDELDSITVLPENAIFTSDFVKNAKKISIFFAS